MKALSGSMGERRVFTGLLLEVVERWSAGQPDLLMLLRGVAPETAQPLLAGYETRTDAYGRGNIAQACAPHQTDGAHDLLVPP